MLNLPSCSLFHVHRHVRTSMYVWVLQPSRATHATFVSCVRDCELVARPLCVCCAMCDVHTSSALCYYQNVITCARCLDSSGIALANTMSGIPKMSLIFITELFRRICSGISLSTFIVAKTMVHTQICCTHTRARMQKQQQQQHDPRKSHIT